MYLETNTVAWVLNLYWQRDKSKSGRSSWFVVLSLYLSKTYQPSVLFNVSAMLDKVEGVQKEVDKLTSSNEMLQTYIDNLTKQMAKRR